MLLREVVETSRQVASTTKRLAKVGLLADLLKRLAPDEIEPVVAFLSGYTRQGTTRTGYAAVRSASVTAAEQASLQIIDVDIALESLTPIRGTGSAARRREVLQSLLARATAEEQEFLMGLLLGGLRQGALEGIMLDALAKASGAGLEKVRRATMMAGDLCKVARTLLEAGEGALDQYGVVVFQPVHPMLAQPAADVDEALTTIGEAIFEYKFDGARIQAHKQGDNVRVYTRALNDVTESVPEVLDMVRAIPARELILDGEVISFKPDGTPQPFQITMRRFGRRLDVEQLRTELPLTPVWFDILYRDGHELVDHPQSERFRILQELVPAKNLIPNTRTAEPDKAEAFFQEALAHGHEGIMAKAASSPYVAGARGQTWLKIKKAHTLDLVILAAEWGNGRRQGWLSNLHLGARDTVNGGFAMLGKTFKGMTDEMLNWQTEALLAIETSRDSYTVFVEPKIVVEIAYSDIQTSPRYKSGLALRFARVKRYRTDKTAAEADTFDTVKKMAG
jgi:DNA ligase-1